MYERNEERNKAHQRKWYKKHPEKALAYQRDFQRQRKVKLLTYYGGGKCACVVCGESRVACLSIDHIRAIGAKRQLNLYCWLVKNGYPDGYQTLCMNCQWVKRALNNESTGRPRIH